MAGRLVQLSSSKGGISRLRTKGGADKDTLYDLLNGYVDASGAIVSRPGTVQAFALPAGTKGLCAVNGGLVVFSHQVVEGMPEGVTCEVLSHPTDPAQPIRKIHFAGPFLGGATGAYLYVVAEFEDGAVFHYWLQTAETWEANTAYLPGQLVSPTTPNGLTYRVGSSLDAYQKWRADVARALGDVVVPTTDNGYFYTVTDTIGSAPKSGTREPNWPDSDGATVYEDTNFDAPDSDDGSSEPPPLPPDVDERYTIHLRRGDYREQQ